MAPQKLEIKNQMPIIRPAVAGSPAGRKFSRPAKKTHDKSCREAATTVVDFAENQRDSSGDNPTCRQLHTKGRAVMMPMV